MTVMVGLLRGVNVGGGGKLAMGDLAAAAAAIGFDPVRTYIQSGNIVFGTELVEVSAVEDQLERVLVERCGLETAVMARTHEGFAAVIASNPFVTRTDDATKLHVTFLKAGAEATLGDFDRGPYTPEEVATSGDLMYLHLPGGIGRSKLATALATQGRPGAVGTTRNWRTVTTLLTIADELT